VAEIIFLDSAPQRSGACGISVTMNIDDQPTNDTFKHFGREFLCNVSSDPLFMFFVLGQEQWRWWWSWCR